MNFFRNILKRRNQDGASAVEYGLLVAAIAAIIVVIVFALGGVIKGAFNSTCNSVQSQGATTTGTCTAPSDANS